MASAWLASLRLALLLLTCWVPCPAVTLSDVALQQALQGEYWGPPLSAQQRAVVRRTGCHPFRVSGFNAADDERCSAYIGNISNWQSIELLKHRRITGEIVIHLLFIVRMLEPGLQAILKPRKDMEGGCEGERELAAFTLDRLLNLSYVPPAVLTRVPVRQLRHAVRHSPELDPEVKVVFQTDIVDFAKKLPVTQADANGKVLIDCSVQLWMYGLRRIVDSVFWYPPYVGVSWYKSGRENHTRHYFTQFSPPPEGKVVSSRDTIILNHFSDMHIFDYLLQNPDRDAECNTYVLQGSSSAGDDLRQHASSPEFVHIDHGRAFLNWSLVANPLGTFMNGTDHGTEFCRFRRSFLEIMRMLNRTTSLAREMEKRVPLMVYTCAHEFQNLDSRLDWVLRVAAACIQKYGEDRVVFD